MEPQRDRYGLVGLVVLAVCLVLPCLALPSFVSSYLNDQLADMGDYQGHISDVDIALWRGAYALRDVEVTKSAGSTWNQMPITAC